MKKLGVKADAPAKKRISAKSPMKASQSVTSLLKKVDEKQSGASASSSSAGMQPKKEEKGNQSTTVAPTLKASDAMDQLMGLAGGSTETKHICGVCNQEIDGDNFVVQKRTQDRVWVKCSSCNRLAARVATALSKRQDLRDGWHDMSKADKELFFREHHGTMGPDLAMAINQQIKHCYSQSSQQQFGTSSSWLDEDDVKEKYKGKDSQIQAILKNAKSMDCPIRQVRLYEVIEYTGATNDTRQHQMDRSIQMTQDSTMKALKSKKTLGDAAPKKKAVGGISPAALKKIQTFKQTAEEMLGKVANEAERAAEVGVPQKLLKTLQLAESNLKGEIATSEVLLEGGGDIGKSQMEILSCFKTVLRDAATAVKKVAMVANQLESVDEAGRGADEGAVLGDAGDEKKGSSDDEEEEAADMK
jgi:hypothetical protein